VAVVNAKGCRQAIHPLPEVYTKFMRGFLSPTEFAFVEID